MSQANDLRTVVFMISLALSGVSVSNGGDPPKNDVETLVRMALQAELDGLPDERDELLKEAIKADPSFAPARWQSGQVANDSKGKSTKGNLARRNAAKNNGARQREQAWLSIEEAEKSAAENQTLADYQKMRQSKPDDAKGNEVLANWCQRRGLKERAKVHWARVLKFQPNHKTALRRLNLKEHEGGWYTREQIVDIKQRRAHAAKLHRKWRPTLLAWRKTFLTRNDRAKDDAQKELKSAVNAEIVGLYEAYLSAHDQKLALSVVDAIADVKEQVATESLLRHAALSKWSSVRTAATEKLKGRPLHGYVPILIDAMMSPYEFQSWTVQNPWDDDQVLALNYSVGQRGKHSDRQLAGTVNILGDGDDSRAREIQEELQERIEEMNEAAARFNEPIGQALRSTTGQNFENDPSQWNDWWNDYNEYQVPEFKPVFTSFQRPTSIIVPRQPFSCFPAGIMVSTQTGKRPIEDIRVGDYVLSQNAVTGELTYKAVMETTVRQSDAIMEVTMNGEDLLVTRGHPMWVNGRQWQMAKQLQRGDLLHSTEGPVKVESIRFLTDSTKVYNLVVADFGTYFVGDSRVLVHDNSLYTPPGVPVPGK